MMDELQQKGTENQDRSAVKKLSQEIIIPKDSNKAWLTLFYSLPKEFVGKRPAFLDLPRCPYEVLRTDKYDNLINTNVFLETVWDSTAWSIWQCLEVPYKDGSGYREIPGSPAQYSGDFPLWRLSYTILPLLRDKYETCGFSFQQLANVPRDTDIPWLTYEQFGNLIGGLVPEIVSEQDWQPMIDTIWNNRTVEDFDKRGSQVKLDFMRSWEHSRSKKKTVSLEQLTEEADEKDEGLEIPDTQAEFEVSVLSELRIAEFTDTLTERDRAILKMKMKGHTAQEIAGAVGYKTHSAVIKRIRLIADRYEEFVSEGYRKYLDTL